MFGERLFVGLLLWLGALRRERGQTLTEYGIVLAVIAVTIVLTALVTFRDQIVTSVDAVTNCLVGAC